MGLIFVLWCALSFIGAVVMYELEEEYCHRPCVNAIGLMCIGSFLLSAAILLYYYTVVSPIGG